MNRATRDKLTSGTNQADLTTGNAVWETPPAIFERLNERFGPFDIDLTADAKRSLCPVWFGPDSPYGPSGYDVLTAGLGEPYGCDWSAFHVSRGFSNPPYGPFIPKLLALAKGHARFCGFTSVLLLPMRVTRGFCDHVMTGASELLFCDRRITFYENGAPRINQKQLAKGKVVYDPAVFDSIIVIYRPNMVGLTPRVGIWDVPSHVPEKAKKRAA